MRSLRNSTLARSARALGFVTCVLALACGALVSNTGSAAAANANTLLQVQPLVASVVAGQPYSAYLKVDGAVRTVTYAQNSGAPAITVSSNGLISAPATLAVGAYKAAGSDSDGTGHGVWSITLTVLAQAPAGFVGTAVRVYSSVYNFDQKKGQTSSLNTPTQYQTQLSKLSPDSLAQFYGAVSQVPEWFQIPAVMESATATFTVASARPAATNANAANAATNANAANAATNAKSATVSVPSTKVTSAATAASPHLAAAPADVADNPVSTYSPDGTGNGYNDSACTGIAASDSIVFGLQIVVDAAGAAYNYVTIDSEVDEASPFPANLLGETGLAVVAVVANSVLLAAEVAHDTIAYLSQAPNECQQNDIAGYVANIDNSTVQSYNLLTSAVSAVADVQASVDATDQDVKGVSSQLGAAQTSLSAAIAQNAHAIQLSVGSGSQGVLSQLQTDNGGLQQDLSTIDNDVFSEVGTAHYYDIQEIDNRASDIQSTLDTDFQTLTQTTTSRFDQVDQHIADLSQKVGDGHTEQIKLQIENALTSTGTTAPVSMLTPGAQGGLLTTPNSWNTSVEDIVLASTTCSTGQADIAASNWKQAFKDFRTCYQAIATLP